MPLELKETRLPGVGVKWTMTPSAGSRITVIQHNDGDREVYIHRRGSDEEPAAVLELHDDEARQLGALLGGAYERPKIVEELEMAARQHGIADLADVTAAVLEEDGSISIIPIDAHTHPSTDKRSAT